MPVSYNSAARNLFLLGSSGQQVAQNFFKYIDKENSVGDGYISTSQIRYFYNDNKYVIAGSGRDLNLVGYGFFDKRNYDQETDPANPTTTLDYETRILSTNPNPSLGFVELLDLHVDSNGDLIVCGHVDGTSPWIAKYSYAAGVLVWQSSTFTGNIHYTNVTSDATGYYACGASTVTGECVVEKYDLNGTPVWGKKISTVGGSSNKIRLVSIYANSRGQVVAVGKIEDLDQTKGYMIKITSNGDYVWDKSLQADKEESSWVYKTRLTDIHIDDKDQLFVSGSLHVSSGNGRNGDRLGWIGKFSAEGNLIWQKQTTNGSGTHMNHHRISADNQTEQVTTVSEWSSLTDEGIALSKYSKNGTLLWRRSLISDSSSFIDNPVLDADSSFYYISFIDENYVTLSNTPYGYVFGKVSTSGNGLGEFDYPDGSGSIDNYKVLNITDEIARLDDGSVRFDSSDLRKTPFSANHIIFDDYSTQVSKKKINAFDAGVMQYSGSPAIRPVDFQEMNLLPTDGVEGRLKGGTFEQPTTSDLDIIFSTPLSPGIVTFDQGSNPDNTSMKNFMQNQLALATAGDTFDFLWYNDDGDADYAELIIDNVTVTNPNTMSGVSFTYTASSSTGIPVSSPPPYSPTTITGSNVDGNYILTRYNRGPELITNGDWENSNANGWTLTGSDTRSNFTSSQGSVSNVLVPYGTTGGIYQSFTTEVGKTYKVSIDSDGGPYVRIFNGSGVSGTTLLTMNTNLSGSGYEVGQTGTFTATSTTSTFAIVDILSGQAVQVDNISVRQTPLRVVVGDQSGNGNDVVVNGASFTPPGFTITTTTPASNTSSENYYDGGGLFPSTTTYSTYGTVVEDATTTLPYSNSDWTHYGGKARDLQSGGFKITFSDNNNPSQDFFMGCWVKFETYTQSRQMGINLAGNYVYWETLANGKVGIRHNGGSRQDSASGTGIDDGNWHYISLSRSGNTLAGCVDGTAVVTTTDGVSGNSVPANADFWFFGGSGTSYNIDGKILDPIIAVNNGNAGGTFIPTKPLIDSSFNFNGGSGGTGPFGLSPGWNYASPGIALGGSTTTTTNNVAGYWEFDGTDDKIVGPPCNTILSADSSIELWVNLDDVTTRQTIISGYDSVPNTNPDRWDFEMNGGTFRGGFHDTGFFTSSTAISIGNWNHVMLVLNSSTNTLKFYLNGVEDLSQSCSGQDFGGPDVNLGIGNRNESVVGPMNGKIAELRIYPRALTAAQAFQNYNAIKSKYINEAPVTAPKISDRAIVYDSNLLLNYDFGNRATYDRAENVVRHSEDFKVDKVQTWGSTDTNWLDKSKLTSNYAMSPFGEMTATRVANDTGSDRFLNYRPNYTGNGSIDVSGQWTVSAFVKPLSNPCTIQLTQWDGFSDSNGVFNLVSGTLSSSNATDANTIEEVGGGWYRISSTATNGNTNTAFQIKFFDGTDLLLYGAQMESGSTLGRYIRTYGTAITAPTTFKNLSSSSYTGTINGPTLNTAGYFEFDGTDDGMTVNSLANFTNITVEWWGTSDYPDTTYRVPVMKTTNTSWTDGFGFYQQSGVVSWWVNQWNGGGVTETQSATTSFGFTHWVGTYDGSNVKLYRNGVLENTASYTTAMTNPNVTFDIGNSKNSYSWDGNIGQVRIYDTALSATEVSQNFNATKSKYGL